MSELFTTESFIPEKDKAYIFTGKITNYLSDLDKLYKILSVTEKEKTDSFKFEKDKNTYTVSHASLRKILSVYCNTSPEELLFETNEFGKPFLTFNLQPPTSNIQFNLSHSKDMFVIAISFSDEIGVDVEEINYAFNFDSIAESQFYPEEKIQLLSYPIDQRHKIFFELWTQKESYLKMKGTGLNEKISVREANENFQLQTHTVENYVFSICTTKNTEVLFIKADF